MIIEPALASVQRSTGSPSRRHPFRRATASGVLSVPRVFRTTTINQHPNTAETLSNKSYPLSLILTPRAEQRLVGPFGP